VFAAGGRPRRDPVAAVMVALAGWVPMLSAHPRESELDAPALPDLSLNHPLPPASFTLPAPNPLWKTSLCAPTQRADFRRPRADWPSRTQVGGSSFAGGAL
jgi:hypothetical protein